MLLSAATLMSGTVQLLYLALLCDTDITRATDPGGCQRISRGTESGRIRRRFPAVFHGKCRMWI